MAALPPTSDFTGSTRTNAEVKATHAALRDYLAGLLGTDGAIATALASLGILASRLAPVSAAATLTAADRGKLFDCTGASYALTLPDRATAGAGWSVMLRNAGSGTVTLTAAGSDLIDGAASAALASGRAVILVALISGWATFATAGAAEGQMIAPAGSVGAPGIALAGSPATGFYRPAANQIAAATNGTLRWLLSGGTMQLDAQMTGTAVQADAFDATPGRLARVNAVGGIFGLGITSAQTPAILADLDSTTEPEGFKQVDATTIGTRPTGFVSTAVGFVHTRRSNANNAITTLTSRTGLPLTWQRKLIAGAWQPWYPVSQPTLGTVAQTSGQPTGALIERASNANGDYARFADGTQICTHTLTGSTGAATTWTYPAAFAAAPAVNANAVATVLSCVMLDAAPGTTSASLSARDSAGARRADSIRVMAIGRWF